MSNNYNKYYSKTNKDSKGTIETEVKDESIEIEEESVVSEAIVEETHEVAESIVEEESAVAKEPEKKEEKSVFGRVNNCTKLNVRKRPNSKAEVICVIPVDSIVEIIKGSTSEFYKVHTESGIEGFCMKDFITI